MMGRDMRECLPKSEIVKAIEHKSPSRVPMVFHHYTPLRLYQNRHAEFRQLLREYPTDVYFHIANMPPVWEESWGIPGYSWMRRVAPAKTAGQSVGLDAEVAIEDWSQLDEVLERLPDPMTHKEFVRAEEDPYEIGGRYTCLHWWNCLFERAWKLRGMENLLMDFHLYPDEVHRLLEAITDFNCQMIRRAAREVKPDGVWVTDDIGMQDRPFFMPETFRTFFKPYYAKMFKTAHDCGMHFWLHSCGCVTPFIEDLIEIGLDVLHPLQKYTMDEREIAAKYGGRLCFWAGMDCQQILPRGTPEDVRKEVRFLVDTFDREEGGCMLALGNVATDDVPLENLRALFDEAYNYGLAHRQRRE